MKLQKIRQQRWFKILSNKYVLVMLVFVFWMFFLDSNSWFVHHELDQEIEKLNENKEFYKQQIAKDKEIIAKLKDSFELEKFAREAYFLKRENEDIYIIEFEEGAENKEKNE